MHDFRGKVAVVTGAASGIGRALAERFAAEQMRVVLADIEEPALAGAARDLEQAGATVLSRRADVSKAGEVEALADAAYTKFGAAHILCNNAGVGGYGGPVWQQSLEAWHWVIDVNLYGAVHGIRSFVPRMLAGGEEGHIVNTASLAGVTSGPMIGPYYVSKHGVVALSESLYLELQLSGASQVGVSVLCPGFVKTRIADSARNSPVAAQSEGRPEFQEMVRGMIEQLGVPPAAIAAEVLAGIRERRFWVLTHPEYDPTIRARAESILERRNPQFVPMGAPGSAGA